jgi:hypothetical protein
MAKKHSRGFWKADPGDSKAEILTIANNEQSRQKNRNKILAMIYIISYIMVYNLQISFSLSN